MKEVKRLYFTYNCTIPVNGKDEAASFDSYQHICLVSSARKQFSVCLSNFHLKQRFGSQFFNNSSWKRFVHRGQRDVLDISRSSHRLYYHSDWDCLESDLFLGTLRQKLNSHTVSQICCHLRVSTTLQSFFVEMIAFSRLLSLSIFAF